MLRNKDQKKRAKAAVTADEAVASDCLDRFLCLSTPDDGTSNILDEVERQESFQMSSAKEKVLGTLNYAQYASAAEARAARLSALAAPQLALITETSRKRDTLDGSCGHGIFAFY